MANQNGLSYRGNVIDKEENKNPELPVQQTTKISKTILSVNKLSRKLPTVDFVDREIFYADDDPEFKKGYINVDAGNTQVVFALLNEMNEVTSTRLWPFDLLVYYTVYNFYKHERIFFTDKQIAEKMCGGKKLKSNHSLIKDVKESIFKLSTTMVSLDYDEQFEKWNKKENIQTTPESKIQEWLLHLKFQTKIIMNNNLVTGYKFIDEPALSGYDSIYGQMITVDDTRIHPQGAFTYNYETLSIQMIMIIKIETMKHLRKNNPKKIINKKDIKLKTLYENLGKSELLNATSRIRKNYLHHVENMLEGFIQTGFIKSYHFEGNSKNGKIIIGKIYDESTEKYY